jgi:hypothetical protein
VVADQTKIRKYVKKYYPLPENPTKPHPVNRDSKGNTILSDGTMRPPQRGDTYAGSEVTKPSPPKKIPSSAWKCNGTNADGTK